MKEKVPKQAEALTKISGAAFIIPIRPLWSVLMHKMQLYEQPETLRSKHLLCCNVLLTTHILTLTLTMIPNNRPDPNPRTNNIISDNS